MPMKKVLMANEVLLASSTATDVSSSRENSHHYIANTPRPRLSLCPKCVPEYHHLYAYSDNQNSSSLSSTSQQRSVTSNNNIPSWRKKCVSNEGATTPVNSECFEYGADDSVEGRMDGVGETTSNGSRNGDDKDRILPYKYQVHGHNIILKWTPKTVLKHTNEREERFYATLQQHSAVLRPWIPKYKGPIHIKCFKEGEGVALKLYNSEDNNEDSVCRIRLDHGKMEVTESSSGFAACYPDTVSLQHPVYKINAAHINPWATFTLSRRLPKLAEAAHEDAVFHRFLVLEDINRKFTHPNILDLKMGTIPLGICDKEESDRVKKVKKWSTTTSASVGVRVDGMQVFSPEEQVFHCYNKFYGNALDETALEGVFEEFLRHYEAHTQRHIAANLLLNLERLKRVIESLTTYRFYSASIIIFCEGRLAKVYNPLLHEERPMKSSSSSVSLSNSSTNFIKILNEAQSQTLLLNRSPSAAQLLSPSQGELDDSLEEQRQQENQHRDNRTGTDSMSPCLLPYLDLRLVDFEHTTFDGFFPGDPVQPGPDKGCLMGLSYLIGALSRFLELHPLASLASTPVG